MPNTGQAPNKTSGTGQTGRFEANFPDRMAEFKVLHAINATYQGEPTHTQIEF